MSQAQMNPDAMGALTYSLFNALNKFSNDPAAYMVQPQVGEITYGSNVYLGENRLNTSGNFRQEWFGRGTAGFGSSAVALGPSFADVRDAITGGKGSDLIYGGWGHTEDFLGGGASYLDTANGGNDVIFGGGGDNGIATEGGNDLVVAGWDLSTNPGTGLNFLSKWVDLVNAAANGTPLPSFTDFGGNNNIGTGIDNDTVITGFGNDTIFAGADDDLVYAGGGQDSVKGGDGYDEIYGEGGNDILLGDEGNDSLYGGAGNDNINGGDGNDLLLGEDGADGIGGGLGNDTLQGGIGNDSLYGWAGDDILWGQADDDTLDGDEGNDTLYGGDGNDSLSGNDDNDKLFGEAGDDILQGDKGTDTLYGGDGNDSLSGNDDNDKLFGEAGNDTLMGGIGADSLLGGTGADKLDGGAGIDLVSYETSLGAVKVDLSILEDGSVKGHFSDAEGDTLIGIENLLGSAYGDMLIGEAGNNVINGNAGNDNIAGQAGDDTLWGGLGNDTLTGNSGVDHLLGGAGDEYYVFETGSSVDFVYENANEGTDYAYLVGLTTIGVYKNGNDLWLAANNNDIMVLADWYVSSNVEYVYFQSSQELFTTQTVAQYAQDITPAAAGLFMSNANMQDVPSFINTELQLNLDIIALAGATPLPPVELV